MGRVNVTNGPTTRLASSQSTSRGFGPLALYNNIGPRSSSEHKYLADGTLSLYKARLVANDITQLSGIDVDETFSPVVKLATIWTIVYMHQPLGFWDSTHLDYVCLFQRSLYGLKHGTGTAYLLMYVDNIVPTTSCEILLHQIIDSLRQEFYMTDLGSLNYFLGISVACDSLGMFLSQRKYATEILERAYMVCIYMYDLWEPHCSALKWILRYVRGTLSYSAEVEYRGVTHAVAKIRWLRNLLREMHTPLSSATLV
ncbi:ribonuclease H-like domain-containing protein [Tanacetum coccineum]